MKKLLIYTTVVCLAMQFAHAQMGKISHIAYISPIPLVVQTDIYMMADFKSSAISSISGKIKVALAPRMSPLETDMYVSLGIPINIELLPIVQYRYLVEGKAITAWRFLPHNTETKLFPYGGLLLDTVVAVKRPIVMQFKFRDSATLLQQYIFSRPQVLPIIAAFRETQAWDPIDNSIKSKALQGRSMIKGFDSLHSGTITLPPGRHLELMFKNQQVKPDSCILYRLVQQDNPAPNQAWDTTGHLLTLNNVFKSGNYILEVKYVGMDAYQTYYLRMQPYWYETLLAKIGFSVLIILALISLPSLYYRNNIKKQKRLRIKAEEKVKMVQGQLNPHFVYNALNSIQGLITNEENGKANEYLSHFSNLMRQTFSYSEHSLIPMSNDLDMMERYVRLEQLRFGFSYCVSIDRSINIDTIELPPMLLQPALENAVKHGVASMESSGRIMVSVKSNQNNLEICIHDNGTQKKQSAGNGYGIKNTKERLRYLQHIHKKGKMTYELRQSESGTTSIFFFQNWIGDL